MPRTWPLAAALASFAVASATPARAGEPTEPAVHVTLPWVVTQLVPSPELAYGRDVARSGARWQLTPLLYSWGIHRGLSPWRFFVAEPFVRQSGSVELFFTPEYLVYGSSLADGAMLRAGTRAYFPLAAQGEYLSASVGTSAFLFEGRWGAAYEVGAYALFGIVGVQLTYTPSAPPIAWMATLRLRYF